MSQIKYKKGYKYKLEEDYKVKIPIYGFEIDTQFIKLTKLGFLTIRKDYSWDGPSGPTIDTKTFMRGSLIHDVLYQLIIEEYLPISYRKASDIVLLIMCKEDGMSFLRRTYVYKAVRIFGGKAIKPRKVFVAP